MSLDLKTVSGEKDKTQRITSIVWKLMINKNRK